MLAERKDLEEEERNKVKSDLDRHEKEVKKALYVYSSIIK